MGNRGRRASGLYRLKLSGGVMHWEDIDDWHQRAKVFGGWIVKTHESVYHTENGVSGGGEGWDWRVSTCFVPDPEYKWVIKK